MHVLINSYTTYEAMSTYFVHNAFVDGAISSSLVLCVQLTIVSITKSQPCLALCTMLDLLFFLEYFNGNQNSSFCCLHLFTLFQNINANRQNDYRLMIRQMMKEGLQFCHFDK